MKDTLTIEEREDLEIELLLEAIYSVSGFDFRKYMRSSIKRRVENRMRLDHISRIRGIIERLSFKYCTAPEKTSRNQNLACGLFNR